jgi:hypothetical protein
MQGENQGASLLDNARDFESFENIEDPDDGGDGLHHPERIPTLKIYYSGYTSAKEIIAEKPSFFRIYPNPANNGIVNISALEPGDITVRIFNVSGKQIKEFERVPANGRLNVEDLKTGFYLIQLEQGDTKTTDKLFIR